MPVPETAVNEDRYSPTRQHDIWPTGQTLILLAKPETARMEGPANHKLWSSVLAPDSRHHPTARHWINYVNHYSFPRF